MTFNEKIKQLRDKHGISQKKLADAIGVAQSSINYWEKGERTPSIDAVQKLANYFDVTLDEILLNDSDINIVDTDVEQLRKEYQDLCYSLTAEELQIMIKIAYAFIKSRNRKDTK
mgnify:CR=1 FL=1